jgi:hypothetical protein
MATHEIESAQPTSTPERTARAWHISKTNGLDEIVVADDCQILNSGVLAFQNRIPLTDTAVIVHAFSPREWFEVLLVDTPYADTLQYRRT